MGKIFYKGVDYSSPTSSGVSGVKGNKETVYRVGNVNITPENVGALAENGDSKDNIVTYTSADATTADTWTDVAVLATGEKHSSLFAKISTMFKNIRYIYTHFIKSENILDTLEEISANTQSGKVAGSLAVKELNRNLETLNTTVKGKQTALKTWTHSFTNVTLKAGTYVKLGTAPSGIRPSNMISIFPYMFGNVAASVVVELENDGSIYAWSSDASYGNSAIAIKVVYV